MSKHSKWSKVKHQKAVTDAKKAKAYTRFARLVTVAAREGGGDPAFNFKLRTAVDLALANNLPKEVIDRAIKRGVGSEDGGRIEEVLYEGYGPGGVGVLVEALTDNRNRTSGNIKHIFSSHGGSLGASGSVQWMFERSAVVRLEDGQNIDDEAELAFIDAGANDVVREEGIIVGAPESLARLRSATEQAGLKVVEAAIEWSPKDPVAVDEGTREGLVELIDALDEDEDVANVVSNAFGS